MPQTPQGLTQRALSRPVCPQRGPGRLLALRAGAVPGRVHGGRGRALPHLRWAELLLPRQPRLQLQPGAGEQRVNSLGERGELAGAEALVELLWVKGD